MTGQERHQRQQEALDTLRGKFEAMEPTGTLTETRTKGSLKVTLQLNGRPLEVLEQLKKLA